MHAEGIPQQLEGRAEVGSNACGSECIQPLNPVSPPALRSHIERLTCARLIGSSCLFQLRSPAHASPGDGLQGAPSLGVLSCV